MPTYTIKKDKNENNEPLPVDQVELEKSETKEIKEIFTAAQLKHNLRMAEDRITAAEAERDLVLSQIAEIKQQTGIDCCK